jgi:hypothetical protein
MLLLRGNILSPQRRKGHKEVNEFDHTYGPSLDLSQNDGTQNDTDSQFQRIVDAIRDQENCPPTLIILSLRSLRLCGESHFEWLITSTH